METDQCPAEAAEIMEDVISESTAETSITDEQMFRKLFSEQKEMTGEMKTSVVRRLKDLLQQHGDDLGACPLCKCQCIDSHAEDEELKTRVEEIDKMFQKQQEEMNLLQNAVYTLTQKIDSFLSNLQLDTNQPFTDEGVYEGNGSIVLQNRASENENPEDLREDKLVVRQRSCSDPGRTKQPGRKQDRSKLSTTSTISDRSTVSVQLSTPYLEAPENGSGPLEHQNHELLSNKEARIGKARKESKRGADHVPELKNEEIVEKEAVVKSNVHVRTNPEIGERWEEPDKERKFAPHEQHWHYLASVEQTEGHREIEGDGGIVTILCVDVSSSVREAGAHTQINKFLNDYISGLEENKVQYNIDEERIALVTFGNNTRVLQRLTGDFSKLREAFGNIKYGGPSPMFGGLMLSFGAERAASCLPLINGVPLHPKIVLITDGKPTDTLMIEGPDDYQLREQEIVRSKIMEIVQQVSGKKMTIDCVCVGDCDKTLLESVTAVSGGRMLTCDEGKRLARTTLDAIGTGMMAGLSGLGGIGGMLGGLLGASSLDTRLQKLLEMQGDMSNTNMKTLAELKERFEKSFDMYCESDACDLPCVGSRVRRGPEWIFGNQDAGGPGTVIGHDKNEHSGQYTGLWVEWDNNGDRNVYRYSSEGGYSVIVVDEERQLKGGELIATGCKVKRGVDWESANDDGGPGSTGIVIKVKKKGQKARVRWTNGKRGVYRFGEEGKFDIEVINAVKSQDGVKFPGERYSLSGGATGSAETQAGSGGIKGQNVKKTSGSKNKNILNKNKKN